MIRMPGVGKWRDEEPLAPQGLVWDAWNRLVTIHEDAEDPVAEYAYDGLHRRITKKTGFATTEVVRHFYYSDRWQVIEERLNISSAAERHFVWGIEGLDNLVLRDELTTGTVTQRLWALNDGKNVTAVALTDDVIERYVYDAFGFTHVYDGDFEPREDSDYGWETRFCGYRWDAESELYQVRYRYYHPSLGRWLSRYPIKEKDGANLFLYVGNSPIQNCDPAGLRREEVFLGTAYTGRIGLQACEFNMFKIYTSDNCCYRETVVKIFLYQGPTVVDVYAILELTDLDIEGASLYLGILHIIEFWSHGIKSLPQIAAMHALIHSLAGMNLDVRVIGEKRKNERVAYWGLQPKDEISFGGTLAKISDKPCAKESDGYIITKRHCTNVDAKTWAALKGKPK